MEVQIAAANLVIHNVCAALSRIAGQG